jgi:myo-inositol-1(or 4)-monophosphatase
MENLIEERMQFAADLARTAGAVVRQGFGRTMQIDHKGATDLVTEYDTRSERLLVDALQRAYPQDSILAEESGAHGDGTIRWLVDPLDGTSNFARSVPFFCISIACAQSEQILVGVVYDPLRDELYRAGRGLGAWMNDQPLRVSDTRSLDDCLTATSFPPDVRTNPDNNLAQFSAASLHTHDVRRIGSAALNLAYVAAGRFDAFWGMRLSPWDLAAGLLLVQEAGGCVSRLDGSPQALQPPTSLLASNGQLHEELIQLLGLHA